MTTRLPAPPGEKTANAMRCSDRSVLAPRFDQQLTALCDRVERRTGARPLVYETMRTATRQTYLYGFGREYDDGRGIVTHSSSNLLTWHGFGAAADCVHPVLYWNAPAEWWAEYGAAARAVGLVWGGDWPMRDYPHVQVGPPARRSPSARAVELLNTGGALAVWKEIRVA